MKNLIKLVTIMIIMVATIENVVSQTATKKLEFGKTPGNDGKVHFTSNDLLNYSEWGLYSMNNTYTTITNQTPQQVFMYQGGGSYYRFLKFGIFNDFLLAPGADTLGITMYLKDFIMSSGFKGNFCIASDSAGTNKRTVVSFDGKNNNTVDSLLLNTTFWTPATLDGVSGWKYCKMYLETDISDAWCITGPDGFKGFYYSYSQSAWCTKYAKKSPSSSGPFIGLGVNVRSLGVRLIGRSIEQSGVLGGPTGFMYTPKMMNVEPITVPASFFAWSENDSTASFNMHWYPSNIENTSIIVEVSQGGIIKGSKTIESSWEVINDPYGLNTSRNDMQDEWLGFNGLQDTTLTTIEVFIKYSDGRKVSQGKSTTYTRKKHVVVVDPVKTDPILNAVSAVDVDSTSAKLILEGITGTNTGSASVTVRVAVLEDNLKTVYEGNIDIQSTQAPTSFTRTVLLTGLLNNTLHTYTVKLLNIEKTGSFTTLKSSSGGGGTVGIVQNSLLEVSAYVDGTYRVHINGLPIGKTLTKEVYNLSGRLLIQTTEQIPDISNLNSGMYFLRIEGFKSVKILR